MKRRFFGQNKKRRDTSKNYFTIEVLEDGQLIKLSNYYEYCIDDEFWNKATSITHINANAGLSIYFKGNIIPSDLTGIGNFIITKKCNLSGNIMSLLYGDEFEGQTDLTGKNLAFYSLFYQCDTIIDASKLVLPATKLANTCYYYMFRGCTSLISAPELPATTLVDFCYTGMFSYCDSLISAPELPATTLTDSCYSSMFYGCGKLSKITMLATDISAYDCLGSWVSEVSHTGTFVKHPQMTSLPRGGSGIPINWIVQDYNVPTHS